VPTMPVPCASVGLTMTIAKPPLRNGSGRAATKVLFLHRNHSFLFTSTPACSSLCAPGLGTFYRRSIFEPGEPQCANACGFFIGGCAHRNGPSAGEATEAVLEGAERTNGTIRRIANPGRPARLQQVDPPRQPTSSATAGRPCRQHRAHAAFCIASGPGAGPDDDHRINGYHPS
jgi:hypothetical protein